MKQFYRTARIAMISLKLYRARFLGTLLLIFFGSIAKSQNDPRLQLDLKNSLADLKHKNAGAKRNPEAIQNIIAVANFYLNNKGYAVSLDSAIYYCDQAYAMASAINYQAGIEDALVMKAWVWTAQNKFGTVQRLINKTSGQLQARLNWVLGTAYFIKDNAGKKDFDEAGKYLSAAWVYADKNKKQPIYLKTLLSRYELLRYKNAPADSCHACFDAFMNACKSQGNKQMEGRGWNFQAWCENRFLERAEYNKKAATAFLAARDTGWYIRSLKEIADCNLELARLDTSEAMLLNVIRLYNSAGYKNLQFTYDLLAAVMINKGSYEAAMRYTLAAIRSAQRTESDFALDNFMFKAMMLCEDLGLEKETVYWSNEIIKFSDKRTDFPYWIYRKVADSKIAAGHAGSTLAELSQIMKKYIPKSRVDFFEINLIKGDCYLALKNIPKATEYYMQAAAIADAGVVWIDGRMEIARALIDVKQYKKASTYLKGILDGQNGIIDVAYKATIYQYQFKIDSAAGDLTSAIKNFESSKRITDSIFNHLRLKQTQELQLQYNTAEKDHENLVLRNKNVEQRSELEKSSLKQKLIGTALLATFLILSLMIYLYVVKQRNNKQLTQQRNEINDQNLQLNKLLGEKEWLVKEIHHRVKNNLQIIASLLNTQSSYLENEEAKTAIRDSQNRMQAISIVHQKLYRSTDLATIGFEFYLKELVQSICDSFHSELNLQFKFDVVDAPLETAQAVPIGLILNEAITNSIKYAFKTTSNPLITITMTAFKEGEYKLTISDNGRGFPENFDLYECTSLGINLIVGLTGQLGGAYEIFTDNGAVISLSFPVQLHENVT